MFTSLQDSPCSGRTFKNDKNVTQAKGAIIELTGKFFVYGVTALAYRWGKCANTSTEFMLKIPKSDFDVSQLFLFYLYLLINPRMLSASAAFQRLHDSCKPLTAVRNSNIITYQFLIFKIADFVMVGYLK